VLFLLHARLPWQPARTEDFFEKKQGMGSFCLDAWGAQKRGLFLTPETRQIPTQAQTCSWPSQVVLQYYSPALFATKCTLVFNKTTITVCKQVERGEQAKKLRNVLLFFAGIFANTRAP
jgi:hypothetical protein